MNNIEKVKQGSIEEFGSDVTQEKYKKIALEGLWDSEVILIKKYFPAESKILDIGCGSGRTTIPLSKMGYDVIGVDITPRMIETAKIIAKSLNLDIDYQVGDATSLNFNSNSFAGAIFANNGWSQIPGRVNRQKALNEIYRILKPGGIFILSAHKRYYDLHNFLSWIYSWKKYYIFKHFGINSEEIEYGDLFFKRHANGKELKQKQFIHMAGTGEIEKQIKESGFKLVLAKSMGEIAESDAKTMKASLSAKFNSFKSPFFYICQK